MTAAGPTFAVAFVTLLAAHQLGDHWIQSDRQAQVKDGAGWPARRACAAHVTTLTVTKVVMLAIAFAVTNIRPSPYLLAAGLAVDAASHYWADRRITLHALAARLGKAEFYDFGRPRVNRDDNPTLGTGSYALDQSWHITWLFAASLIIAAGAR